MSLDIMFKRCEKIVCPHCNEIVSMKDVDCEDSGGRGWYPILEQLGYYVPYDKRTEENDWYGKDMVLTKEQVTQVADFIRKHLDLYNAYEILGLICVAIVSKETVVINADW
jgi:hypothetical protein